MQYNGRYEIFNPEQINTYPLSRRTNKVTIKDIICPADVESLTIDLPERTCSDIDTVARSIVSARQAEKPVIIFTGAHLVKNGLGPLLAELVKLGFVTLVAGNCATAIHDFELALIGETSENVPQALNKGQFGMAYEFCYFNAAISLGDKCKLGFGESLGKMICDASFRSEVLSAVGRQSSANEFLHPEISVLAVCYDNNVAFTVHAGIGTDVVDQHSCFDGRAKGGCSGRDFLIYTKEITKLVNGGVIVNIGSAVTGPEVLLKAVSMAANTGSAPKNIITADFDLRDHASDQMDDESSQGYYFRDQKSITTRVPQAFDGRGFYIHGNQKLTVPLLYKKILEYCHG